MKKGNVIWWVIILVAVAAGTIFLMGRDEKTAGTGQNQTQEENQEQSQMEEYENDQYGFSFDIPEGYDIRETQPRSGEHYIMLSPKGFQAPQGGEGPPMITVHVIRANSTSTDLSSWLRSNNVSNFNLATGSLASTTVDGTAAVRYNHDGLYAARVVALIHRGNIILITGQYMDRNDPIYSDFDKVVSSFELE